ncbi:[protein-PII] uridylyltransferase [Leucothrix arctica]|uniref:[protein-PII] uridylyltransferase n=1 Tax=Leucothrix arctica TaxID=1481894 RepID=UPI001304BF50|nr:[protein-PII] uridylyltransferase [Leucothrix arctica]
MILKELLDESYLKLKQDFEKKVHIKQLLLDRSNTIDHVVSELWNSCGLMDNDSTSLVAVGGYGRAEMHPASDVDLLLLLKDEPDSALEEKLSDFLTSLWDLGLEIGHSVRTVEQCVEEAVLDLTVITNLIESRHIIGNKGLFEDLHEQISTDKIWPSHTFFDAKMEEQRQRYRQYGDTAYRVEPNLKEGPGGLRDIQTIDWVIERTYNITLQNTPTSSEQKLLNPVELNLLIEGKHFLWSVRFALHMLAARKEDRLLFDYQRDLAHAFGYTEDADNQSVEQFMQRYYRTITELERLNEVLLGVLRKRILPPSNVDPVEISPLYMNDDGYLAISAPDIFKKHPHALLGVFHQLQLTPDLKDLTPDTIRAIRNNLPLINDAFRNKAEHKEIFIDILKESNGITFVLRRMNRYGVLAAYIPAFANIVGRMQYDLFHAFTVDDHTLGLVRNLRQLTIAKGRKKNPFQAKVFDKIHKPELLYLAALFHDIAKGRKGSHSELGAVDALEFCKSHGLSDYDSNLVSWLVKHHLTMSTTAQRKDISDPEVIQKFADIIALPHRLDHLYLLTVSDIRSTNPTLLTAWKSSLLVELFKSTSNCLKQQETLSISTQELLQEKKESVLGLLANDDVPEEYCSEFWTNMRQEYLIQQPVNIQAWHIKELKRAEKKKTVIRIREAAKGTSTQLFIYTKDKDVLFPKICAVLEQMQLNIVAAYLATGNDGFALDTIIFLNSKGKPVSLKSDQEVILKTIKRSLKKKNFDIDDGHYRVPRQLQYFDTPTTVHFSQGNANKQTILTLQAADTPGLLSRVSKVFHTKGIVVHNARIATLGEQAEDIFYITTLVNQPITDKNMQKDIRDAIKETLQQAEL